MASCLVLPLVVRRARRTAARSRGMTLVEILVVMGLMVVMVGILVAGSGQTNGARLRQAAAMVTGAVRVAFSKSSARAKPLRLVFDMETSSIAIEESEDVMLLAKDDTSGTGGAEPMTEFEQAALAEGERILAGPKAPRATFRPLENAEFGVNTPGKGPKPLPRNIHFKSVHCEHDSEPRTERRAYLYFWPGGQTERCVIQLRIGNSDDDQDAEDVLSLSVSPLTGKVVVKGGVVDFVDPEGDREASEREEPGGTL